MHYLALFCALFVIPSTQSRWLTEVPFKLRNVAEGTCVYFDHDESNFQSKALLGDCSTANLLKATELSSGIISYIQPLNDKALCLGLLPLPNLGNVIGFPPSIELPSIPEIPGDLLKAFYRLTLCSFDTTSAMAVTEVTEGTFFIVTPTFGAHMTASDNHANVEATGANQSNPKALWTQILVLEP